MKIDLSAVAIILIFVAPGYLAYRTRNRFAPRSLAPKGPTEEFAGFVVVSALIQALLGLIVVLCAVLGGLAFHHGPFWLMTGQHGAELYGWLSLRQDVGFAVLALDFLISCGFGYFIGLPLALLDLSWEGWLWSWTRSGRSGNWLRRHGLRGIIGEHPAIYVALRPDLDEHGRQKVVFVEAELRDSKGFYTGQVASYSLARDEEAHKLVLLRDAWFRPDASSENEPVQSDTVLIDLTDVLVLRIQQAPNRQVEP